MHGKAFFNLQDCFIDVDCRDLKRTPVLEMLIIIITEESHHRIMDLVITTGVSNLVITIAG